MYFCSAGQNSKDPYWWTSTDAPDGEWHNPEWMTNLPNDKHLSELSIPGTHDTMAFHTQQVGNDWVWCQCWGLGLQMSMEICFFDIRCRNFNNDLPLHHEQYYLDCRFDDVLRRVTEYLNEHPHEFFIMNVQEEYPQGGRGTGTETFAQKVNRYLAGFSDFVYSGESENSMVAEMRGKIIILAHVDIHSPYLGWDDFIIDNHWSNTKEKKIEQVKKSLDNARTGNKKSVYLTFTNYVDGITTVKLTSNGVNPEIHRHVRNNPGRLGMIAMDYPDLSSFAISKITTSKYSVNSFSTQLRLNVLALFIAKTSPGNARTGSRKLLCLSFTSYGDE